MSASFVPPKNALPRRNLMALKRDNRVYLNVKPEAMFAELHRLGLPDETTPGFSYKNFTNYFNIGD